MNLNRKNIKKIQLLIIFTGIVCLCLIKVDLIWNAFLFLFSILKPFIFGGMIAFVINIPMGFIEKKLFKNSSVTTQKPFISKIRRPVSLILAIIAVILVVTVVILTVIPQIINTARVLGNEIPVFWVKAIDTLEVLFAANPELMKQLQQLQSIQLDWDSISKTMFDFLKNGVGTMLTSTFTVAGSIVSGTVNFFISFVFSFYVLMQKERLGNQFKRVLKAYTGKRIYEYTLKVTHLLYQNFSHFITGQCAEAVILGTMFAVAMLIFGFPYAIMVGVLIAFTALIPIVGAFIGCFIGAFLILVDSPTKVIWFLVLFIVLQQIEGNLIYPYVVGNSVGLPSIWVLAAVTVGGSLMGVAGMLIFIPLLSTVYVLLKENVNNRNGSGINEPDTKRSGPPGVREVKQGKAEE